MLSLPQSSFPCSSEHYPGYPKLKGTNKINFTSIYFGSTTISDVARFKLSKLTFSRVYSNARPVQHLLALPILVPPHSLQAVEKQQTCSTAQQERSGASRPAANKHAPHPYSHEQTEAHTGYVQHPLGHHKAHVEEHISGWDEGQNQQPE